MGAADPAWGGLAVAVWAYILDIPIPLEIEVNMSIGGLKFAETLTAEQY